eukprot:CAMPEP_0198202560 /NCGR_PEP_ID=MMETSP1445-20131203/5738_1 /TAXON_ID=36898 /ORGANISM="Pyramimonas sp., Strain CCMP2087" /LENGTH=350 /DNA_ID=CAMNT_0043873543 /DNA_START=222 /DNA_END=1278 /DNA_ORIENTATION=-
MARDLALDAAEYANGGECELSDEELKELFDLAKHMEKGVEVVDRTYNLTSYRQCFIGSEAVDWLITSGAAASVEDAIALGNLIFKARLIRQVANEHAFENAYLFYRFRHPNHAKEPAALACTPDHPNRITVSSSQTLTPSKAQADEARQRKAEPQTQDPALSDAELVDLAKRMQEEITVGEHTYRFRTYTQCFVGREAVEWMVKSGAAGSEEKAVALGNLMLKKAGLIYHVYNDHEFENAHIFYRFRLDRSQKPLLGQKAVTPTIGAEAIGDSTRRMMCLSLAKDQMEKAHQHEAELQKQVDALEACNRALEEENTDLLRQTESTAAALEDRRHNILYLDDLLLAASGVE